jgi:hypothetical protein
MDRRNGRSDGHFYLKTSILTTLFHACLLMALGDGSKTLEKNSLAMDVTAYHGCHAVPMLQREGSHLVKLRQQQYSEFSRLGILLSFGGAVT